VILVDFKCRDCGKIEEVLVDSSKWIDFCLCGGVCDRIISFGKVYTGNVDCDWVKTVVEVADKENPAPHVQEFVKNPNRRTYKNWMKGEGLRPMDSNVRGAPPAYQKPQGPDPAKLRKELVEKHVARRRIEI